MNIYVGSSGWSYEAWEGIFYPLNEKEKLKFYSRYFNTVEIDSTFYSYPSFIQINSWLKNTPEGFIFAMKIPKLITHEKKLSTDSLIDLNKFLTIIEPLKQKLGPLLIQLPPSFRKEKHEERLANFLANLNFQYNWAVEFRDLSWIDASTFKLLEKYNIAYTIVDEPLLPKDVYITSSISIFRFHGRGKSIWYNYLYKDEEIDEWSSKIVDTAKKTRHVYVYFNNHYRAFAVTNALQLLKKLGMTNKEQEEMLRKLSSSIKQEYKGLLGFAEKQGDSLQLLKKFTTDSRFERALSIDKNEINILELSEERWRGWVSGYFIEIDFEKKKIKHECQDWINNVEAKQFMLCKHILAFMREIPEELVKKFLIEIEKKEDWQFEAKISF